VGSDGVVLPAPHPDQYLSLLQRIEDLPCQQFVSHFPIEQFNISIFPGTARFDEQRLDFQSAQPGTHFLGGELRAIIRTQVDGHATLSKQPSQDFQHIFMCEAACDLHGQIFMGVLINNVQNAEWIAVLGGVQSPLFPAPAVIDLLAFF
jgi:hypothetical protein